MEEQRTDCEVCKKLIQEKHQNMMWWKIFCVIFAITTVVFGILYFGSGAVVTQTDIEVEKVDIDNGGDENSNNVVIGSKQITDAYNGTIEQTNYTPIICVTVLGSIVILLIGGGIIANYVKKKD